VSGRRTDLVFAASIFLLALAVRAPLIDLPFERDEGGYAYIAWRLDFGELPYRDWVDQKPPAVFWLYRLALAFPGDPVQNVHWLGALFWAGSAVGLFHLARSFLGRFGAAAAAFALCAFSADPMIQGTAVNTETLTLLPTVLAHLVFARCAGEAGPGRLRPFEVGLLVGVATACKQVAAVNWVFFALIFPFLIGGARRWSRSLSLVAWSALGVAAVWAVIVGGFLAAGALPEMVYNVFTHNLEYVSALSVEMRIERLLAALRLLFASQSALWLLGGTGIALVLGAGERRLAAYLIGWLALSAVGTSAGGHYFPHYFQQLLPPLAFAAGAAAERIRAAKPWRGAPSWVRGAVVAAVVAAQPALVLASFWAPRGGAGAPIRRIYPGNYFDAMPEIAAIIADLTRADDEIFVFGAEPELLFYARRRASSRYIYQFPLYGPFDDALEKQREMVAEIRASRPRLIVYMPNQMFFGPDTEQFFTRWLISYIQRQYDPRYVSVIEADGTARVRPSDSADPLRFPRAGDYGILFRRRDAR